MAPLLMLKYYQKIRIDKEIDINVDLVSKIGQCSRTGNKLILLSKFCVMIKES